MAAFRCSTVAEAHSCPTPAGIRRLVSAAAMVSALVLGCPAWAQSAADVAAARELFIEGSELSKAGQWEQARDRFERSLALKRAPITLYSLGVAQMSTGQHVEALESFRAFLAEPATETTEAYVEPAKGAIEELARRVARLDIRIRPPRVRDLVVTVDRQRVPNAALGVPRLVNAGKHVVRAEAPGFAGRTVAVTVAEAQTAPVVLVLGQGGGSSDGDAGTSDGSTSDFPTGPVVLLVTGGVAAGAGIAVGLVGVAEAGDAPSADSPEADGARTKATVGDVVTALGIGTAVAGLLWLLLDDGGASATAADARATDHVTGWRPRPSADGLTWSF